MENLMLSVNAVMPMFLIIAAGYLARYLNILSRADVPKFNKVAFRVFIPCLLFHNIYSSDLSQAIRPRLMLFAVAGVLFVFTCAILAVRRFEPIPDRKGVVAQGIFRSNFVIMGLPIAEALVGPENLGPVSVLIAVVVPLFNLLAVITLESFRGGKPNPGHMLLQIITNPFVAGSLLGILFLLLKIKLPYFISHAVQNLGSIGTPLQLFLLGAFFRFDGLKRYKKELTILTLVKLVITPAIMLSLAILLGFRGIEFVALIGIFASPTAVNSFTMAQQMEAGDAELAGDIVMSTSAFCIPTFFLWIWLFKSLGIF